MARSSFIKTGSGIAIVSLMAGVAPTVIGMVRAFADMASQSAVDAKSSSELVEMGMKWTRVALPFVALGVAIYIAGLFLAPKRSQ